jgi:predicted RNA methylase
VRRDLGDFQTPPELVDAVLDSLGSIGARWPRVLEPTCGRGNFLAGLLALPSPPREIRAVEIQPEHCRAAEEMIRSHRHPESHVSITCGDVFRLDLGRDLNWRERGPLLVVGNPPWITSAELGRLAGASLPPKANVKGLSGLEARTGSSNFDVAEAVWLKLAGEL